MADLPSQWGALLLSLLLWGHLTAALGPPNGTLGTLDWRYPDIIVEPLVHCPHEGTFPHPRSVDCTWYYRCYDRYGLGFFWRSYYQCEPGTQFSDELDQCIFQSDNAGCQVVTPGITLPACTYSFKECRVTSICPQTAIGTSFGSTVELCENVQEVCRGRPNADICHQDQIYDNTNGRCILRGDICPPSPGDDVAKESPIICEDQLENCADYTVCRGNSDAEHLRLCLVNKRCYNTDGANSSHSICGLNELFNAFTNQCTRIPQPEEACPGGQLETYIPVQCTQETETCQVYTDCASRESFLACHSYFMCGNALRRAACPGPNQLYVPKLDRCIQARPDYKQRQSSDTPPCYDTGVTYPKEPVNTKDYIDNYICNSAGERPKYALGHEQLGCSVKRICHNTQDVPEVTVTGCDSYFECTDSGVMEIKSCLSGYFFDFNTLTCTNPKAYGNDYGYCSQSSTNKTINVTIKCIKDKAIGEMSETAKRVHCYYNFLCNSTGSFLGQEQVCDTYHLCEVDPTTGIRSPVPKQCDADMKFILDKEICDTPQLSCGSYRYSSQENFLSILRIYQTYPNPAERNEILHRHNIRQTSPTNPQYAGNSIARQENIQHNLLPQNEYQSAPVVSPLFSGPIAHSLNLPSRQKISQPLPQQPIPQQPFLQQSFPQQPSQQPIPQQTFLQQPFPQQSFPQQPSQQTIPHQTFLQQPFTQQSFPQQPSQQPIPHQTFLQQPFPQQSFPQQPSQQPVPHQTFLQQPFPQQSFPQQPSQQPFPQQPFQRNVHQEGRIAGGDPNLFGFY